MTNYPIGDFLIQIKNAGLARRRDVVVDKTKYIKAVADALKKEGYLERVEVKKNILTVTLSYRERKPVLVNLKIVSKPGLRIYKNADELDKFRSPSIFILSTPKGVMSSREAIKKRLGGEVIVQIW